MVRSTSRQQDQSGNILFLILLAVVLFAALSYAVTSSMRGGGNDGSGESADARAAEILNYFGQFDTAIQRMMLTGGLKDYEINFYTGNGYTSGMYDNSNCTASNCRIFDPAGGGVMGRKTDSYTRAGGTGSSARLHLLSVTGAGTSLPDLVMSFYGIDMELCKEINSRMGLGNDIIYNVSLASNSTTLLYFYNPYPTGAWPSSTAALNAGQAAGIAGTFCTCGGAQSAGCPSTFDPMVHRVLIAR